MLNISTKMQNIVDPCLCKYLQRTVLGRRIDRGQRSSEGSCLRWPSQNVLLICDRNCTSKRTEQGTRLVKAAYCETTHQFLPEEGCWRETTLIHRCSHHGGKTRFIFWSKCSNGVSVSDIDRVTSLLSYWVKVQAQMAAITGHRTGCSTESMLNNWCGSALLLLLLSADISASTLGRLQGHGDKFRLLLQLQHHSLPNRLWDTIPGGELQLQDGPHAR